VPGTGCARHGCACLVESGDPEWITADQIGAVAGAASAATTVAGREVRIRNRAEAGEALSLLQAT
jgi:hypothetical protein